MRPSTSYGYAGPPPRPYTPRPLPPPRTPEDVAARSARDRSYREQLIARGLLVPMEARVTADGITIFHNHARIKVLNQGRLTKAQLDAPHEDINDDEFS